MLRIATAVFLLSPVVAQAQCLTPEALDTGITITFGNGNLSYVQRTASGSILDAYDNQQSYYKEIILLETLDGVIELSRVSHEKDQWSPVTSGRMAYDFAVEILAPYMPGTRGGGSATRAWGGRCGSWIGAWGGAYAFSRFALRGRGAWPPWPVHHDGCFAESR